MFLMTRDYQTWHVVVSALHAMLLISKWTISSLVFPSSLVTVHSLRWLTHLCERSTINLVNSQIGNHLKYKSRSTYESNNIDWALLNVDTFFIIVEILWLHIKLICKLERIGGSIWYFQKQNKHWIPFIYDLRMLWSPVQNFESALGITCPHSFPLDFISGSRDLLKED